LSSSTPSGVCAQHRWAGRTHGRSLSSGNLEPWSGMQQQAIKNDWWQKWGTPHGTYAMVPLPKPHVACRHLGKDAPASTQGWARGTQNWKQIDQVKEISILFIFNFLLGYICCTEEIHYDNFK
jgi:hypothetical protein